MATLDGGKISKLLRLAQKFNSFYINEWAKKQCHPFIVDGMLVGLIRPDIYKHLLDYKDVFTFHAPPPAGLNSSNTSSAAFPDDYRVGSVELARQYQTYEDRTKVVDRVLRELREKRCLVALKGWRDECYEVKANTRPLMKMDRSATCLFGIRNYGVHINGFVRHPTDGLCVWLQQRSKTKQTWPGKWDNMVCGGLSVGYGVRETAIKEAAEEASIPEHLTTEMRPAGAISLFFESERGLFPNTEYVFDLELPLDFVPFNADGEVQDFQLLSARDCYERLFSDDFKTTSVPVVLDFLIRQGLVTPETEPNYTQVQELLHVPLQGLLGDAMDPVSCRPIVGKVAATAVDNEIKSNGMHSQE